jgi:hypothetical protein
VDHDTVFGYVRLTRPDRERLKRLRQQITDYCRAEELSLELVFGDSGIGDTVLTRPAWTALMDRLNYSAAYAVVVPTLDHLSRDVTLRAEQRTQVVVTGAALLVMPAPLFMANARSRR